MSGSKMELKINSRGPDLQNVFVFFCHQIPRNNASPFSRGIYFFRYSKINRRKESLTTPFRKINRGISRESVKLTRPTQV
jgi:hypothetical protein